MIARRLITSAIVVAVAGALAAPAAAYDGDWVMNGRFERTTAPSFTPGFNPNDIDSFVGSFDNRGKTLSFGLTFFERPSDGMFQVRLGRFSGSSCSEDIVMSVFYEGHYVTETYTVEGRTWVPDSYETSYTVSPQPPAGAGWVYSGLTQQGYQWVRFVAGHYVPTTETRTALVLDTNRHIRDARLTVSGIDGSLSHRITTANDSRSWYFSFAHPLLNRLQADCGSISIPGRRVSYHMSPNVPVEPPLVNPQPTGPLPDPTTAESYAIAAPTSRALRDGSRLTISSSGEADKVQVRVRGRVVTKRYSPSIRINGATGKTIRVRFLVDNRWTNWHTLVIK